MATPENLHPIRDKHAAVVHKNTGFRELIVRRVRDSM